MQARLCARQQAQMHLSERILQKRSRSSSDVLLIDQRQGNPQGPILPSRVNWNRPRPLPEHEQAATAPQRWGMRQEMQSEDARYTGSSHPNQALARDKDRDGQDEGMGHCLSHPRPKPIHCLVAHRTTQPTCHPVARTTWVQVLGPFLPLSITHHQA